MLKKGLLLVILAGFSLIFVDLIGSFSGNTELPALGKYYAENAPQEVGAANLVTAIIVTYRGFDTLGEVVILFLTASIIGFFLKIAKEDKVENDGALRQSSEILQTASKALTPLIFLFGVYIFINGHLTPGGGFQGGAVIATGFVLMLMANPKMKVNHGIISFVESISGISFVLIGVAGLLFAGGFLDNRLFDLGVFGEIISAGVIPIIYVFVGLKVGSELSSIVGSFKESQTEA